MPATSPAVQPDPELARTVGPHQDWRRALRQAASDAVSRGRQTDLDDQATGVPNSAGFRAWLAGRAALHPTTMLREAFPSVQQVQSAAGLTDDQVFDVHVVEVPVEGTFAEIVDPTLVLAAPGAILAGDLTAVLAECARRQQS